MKKEQFSGVTCGPGDQGEICSCPQKEYVIAEEQEALAMLRQIKEKVKVEKARIEQAKQHLKASSEKTEERRAAHAECVAPFHPAQQPLREKRKDENTP